MIMTGRPKVVIHQHQQVPGIQEAEANLILHAVTADNYTQRITIARRVFPADRIPVQPTRWRYFDMFLTRAQLYDLVGELDERAALMTDHTTGGTPV